MQETYDIYDRLEDEALERLRNISAMSDEETDTEGDAEHEIQSLGRMTRRRSITLTIPSVNTEDQNEKVEWMLKLFEQTFEHEAGRDPEHEDSTTFWRRIKHPEETVFKFVLDGEMSQCVVQFTDGKELVIREKDEFKEIVSHMTSK
jgi:hypothetical protein